VPWGLNILEFKAAPGREKGTGGDWAAFGRGGVETGRGGNGQANTKTEGEPGENSGPIQIVGPNLTNMAQKKKKTAPQELTSVK